MISGDNKGVLDRFLKRRENLMVVKNFFLRSIAVTISLRFASLGCMTPGRTKQIVKMAPEHKSPEFRNIKEHLTYHYLIWMQQRQQKVLWKPIDR